MTAEEFEAILDRVVIRLGDEVRANTAIHAPDLFEKRVQEVLEELAAGLKSKMAGFRKSGDVLDEVEHYRGHQVTMHCAAELRRHAKSAPTAWPEENDAGQPRPAERS